MADLAGADDQHRRGRLTVTPCQGVQRGDLRLGTRNDDDVVGLDHGIRKRRLQPPVLPQPDHAQPGPFPQPRVADRLPGEHRVARGQLGDLEPAIRTDDVRVAAGVGAVGEILTELVLERKHGARAAELQHVDGVLLLYDRHDRHVRGNFPGGNRDVGVGRILAVGQQHAGTFRVGALVGGAAVVLAGDDHDALADQPGGLDRVGLDHVVGNLLGPEPFDQACRDCVVLGEDHVVTRARRHLARRPQPDARLEPRRVEQADEHERQHHQQQDDSREQHDNAEQPAGIARERDVAESQRGHHHQRPVEAGDPGVLLALDRDLDDVEQDCVDGDDGEQREYVP